MDNTNELVVAPIGEERVWGLMGSGRGELCIVVVIHDQQANQLPEGWTCEERTRSYGASVGTRDFYFYSPKGKCYRSLKKVYESLGWA